MRKQGAKYWNGNQASTTIGIFPIAVLPISVIAESPGVSVAVGAGGLIMVLFIIAMTVLRPSFRSL